MRTHHLQFVEKGSVGWQNHILIKEYYLKHPEVAKKYAELKAKLAKKYPENRVKYTAGKQKFVNAILKKAKKNKA